MRLRVFLGWSLWAVLMATLLVWRWNHEAVRLYDAPPIRVPGLGVR
jgi:hypothetical protein